MASTIVCKGCASVYTNPPSFCRKCGGRLRYRKLFGTAKWGSWSLATFSWAFFTFHLFSFKSCVTIEPPAVSSPETLINSVNTNVSNTNGNVSIINNVNYYPPPEPRKPPEADGRYVREAVDKNRKRASFVIYLFSDEYRWQIGRSDALENGATKISFTPQMQENLNKAEEVICIGASSEQIEEGLTPEQGRIKEENRAAERAETIAEWIRPVLRNHVLVKKLNIGHHAAYQSSSGDDKTSDQRRVIIVLVLKKEDGVNVDEALKNAFEREKEHQPIYGRILTKYSLTQGPRLHWIE